MSKVIKKIINEEQHVDFFETNPTIRNVKIHKDFNPKNKNIFYIRQSKKDDKDYKDWQTTIVKNKNNSEENIVLSTNSAYKEKQADYIFKIIKYIVEKGNKTFTLHVADYSRFSRNLNVTSLIYNYIYDRNINLTLNVDGDVYSYIDDYYPKLRDMFKNCEKFSDDLSRVMKKVSSKRKLQKIMDNNSKLATDYFKYFISYFQKIETRHLLELKRHNLSLVKIAKYKRESKDLLNKFHFNGDLHYFYCPLINCRIVCPLEIAQLENIDSTIIKGFDQEDFLAIAESGNEYLEWSCYHYDNFDLGNLKKSLK